MAKGDYPRYEDGDLICPVCDEPWERYSINRLEDDWTAPQVAAFRAGQGCPSCLGEAELTRLGNEILAKDKGPHVCDGCLTAAYDEGAFDPDDAMGSKKLQVTICTTMGAEIPDHVCEDPADCKCACPKPAAPRDDSRRRDQVHTQASARQGRV
jgi:hypothetical protein